MATRHEGVGFVQVHNPYEGVAGVAVGDTVYASDGTTPIGRVVTEPDKNGNYSVLVSGVTDNDITGTFSWDSNVSVSLRDEAIVKVNRNNRILKAIESWVNNGGDRDDSRISRILEKFTTVNMYQDAEVKHVVRTPGGAPLKVTHGGWMKVTY